MKMALMLQIGRAAGKSERRVLTKVALSFPAMDIYFNDQSLHSFFGSSRKQCFLNLSFRVIGVHLMVIISDFLVFPRRFYL